MSEIKVMECCCCGNRNAKSFKQYESGYICGCCGAAFYLDGDKRASNDEKQRIARGYANLQNYEFSKARGTFSDVLRDYPKSIDARWGLLLAKYGVVFIKGFFDDDVEPIYCFPEYDELKNKTFRGETEYLELIDLIEEDEDMMDFYEKKSRKIDTAIKKFRQSVNEIDRDVFICVKISAATERNPNAPGRTEDYELAQKIYKDLRAKGINVFFSFVTLKNEVQSDHEIWLNLVKSKKMLLIGSREEYIESAWVKSEWKRWLFLDRDDDMYIFSMRHTNESPKSILPHELRTTQIYTLDTYDKLISDISGETAAEEAEFKKREAEEAERKKREAEEAERKKREAEEAERKKLAAEEAERKRKEREATAAKRKSYAKEHAPAIITWVLVILAIAATVICNIFFEATRAWFIAMGIAVVYTLFWNFIRRKTEFNYVPWYILTNVGLSIACIPLYCISATTRAYAFGFAVAVLASSIGLLVKAWKDKTVERTSEQVRRWQPYGGYGYDTVYYNTYTFKYNPIEYASTFYFTLIGGVLLSIAVGCLFSGMAMALVVGCGVAVVYIAMSVLTTFLYCDGDTETTFTVIDVILGVVGVAFLFVSYNFSVCAMCLFAAAVLSAFILAIRRRENSFFVVAGIGIALIGIAVLVLLFGHKPASEEFKIKDGVLLSYGGTAEVVVIPEEVTAIDAKAFKYSGPQKNMKEVVLHDGITSIGTSAFENCDALTSVTIPGSVYSVSEKAFYECDKLASVTIEEGVKQLGISSFGECDSIVSITLPESMEKLESYCFEFCDKLDEIYINSGVKYMGSGIFSSVDLTIYYDGSKSQWESIETPWIKWNYLIDNHEVIYAN